MQRCGIVVRNLFISLLVGTFCAPRSFGAATIQEAPHPCHFIFLVDASGSTVASKRRASRYRTVLLDSVLPKLYSGTLSARVPSVDPKQDLISVFHFGVVNHSGKRGLMELSTIDLLESEIHRIRTAVSATDREDVARSLFPEVTYNLTLLSVAKPLAINALPSVLASRTIAHTYIVLVTDGLANGRSLSTETGEILKKNRQEMTRTVNARDQVESSYEFTPIAQTRKEFLVEVTEVSPRNWNSGVQALIATGLLTDLTVRWTCESSAPEGVITGRIRKSELSGILPLRIEAAAGAAIDQSNARLAPLAPSFSLAFGLRRPLSCGEVEVPVLAKADLQFKDPKLGTRLAKYQSSEAVIATVSCTPFLVWPVVIGTSIIALAIVVFVVVRGRPPIMPTPPERAESIPSPAQEDATRDVITATPEAELTGTNDPSQSAVDATHRSPELAPDEARDRPPLSTEEGQDLRSAGEEEIESKSEEQLCEPVKNGLTDTNESIRTGTEGTEMRAADYPSQSAVDLLHRGPEAERDEARDRPAMVDVVFNLRTHPVSRDRADSPAVPFKDAGALKDFLDGTGPS